MIKTFKKLFTGINMSWVKVIIFAVVSAVVVAVLNLIPILKDSSFTIPAVTFEPWIILACIIIFNCNKVLEAMAKTFVFFLISQPLIYLIEVPFNSMGWGLFQYYGYWAIWTVLTIPGAFIAYQVKRNNILSGIILSVATGYLLISAVIFGLDLPNTFPRYTLHIIFCLFFAFILIWVMLQGKVERIVAIGISIVMALGYMAYDFNQNPTVTKDVQLDSKYTWTIDSEKSETYTASIDSKEVLHFSTKISGDTIVNVKNNKGQKYSVWFKIQNNKATYTIEKE